MAGIGLILGLVGYVSVTWGVNAIQGNTQPSFAKQIFPFVK